MRTKLQTRALIGTVLASILVGIITLLPDAIEAISTIGGLK